MRRLWRSLLFERARRIETCSISAARQEDGERKSSALTLSHYVVSMLAWECGRNLRPRSTCAGQQAQNDPLPKLWYVPKRPTLA